MVFQNIIIISSCVWELLFSMSSKLNVFLLCDTFPLCPLGYSVAGSWGAPPCQRQSALLALWAPPLWRQALCLEGGAERREPLCRNPSRSFARGQQRQVSRRNLFVRDWKKNLFGQTFLSLIIFMIFEMKQKVNYWFIANKTNELISSLSNGCVKTDPCAFLICTVDELLYLNKTCL